MKSFPLSHWLTQWLLPVMTTSQNTTKFDLPELGQYAPPDHTSQDEVDLSLGFTHPNFRHWTWFKRSTD